jgi:phosphoglycolate phosphatase
MRPQLFDAIVFDLDGTLADSAADIGTALRQAFAELHIKVTLPIESLIDGSPLEEIFALVAPEADGAMFDRFAMRYRDLYRASDHAQTHLYPGVMDTLEALSVLSPRMKLAVATSKRLDAAHGFCVAMGIASFFDAIDGSGGSNIRPKPAPDLLIRVAKTLRVDPRRTLMVGDTTRDVMAGRTAGMTTAAVLYGMGSLDSLQAAQPDHTFEDIEDVLSLVAARS